MEQTFNYFVSFWVNYKDGRRDVIQNYTINLDRKILTGDDIVHIEENVLMLPPYRHVTIINFILLNQE